MHQTLAERFALLVVKASDRRECILLVHQYGKGVGSHEKKMAGLGS